jgi:hypothetical protein
MGCAAARHGERHGWRDESTEAFIAHAQKMAGIFAVCVAIWAVGGFGAFWPGWVLLFGGLSLGRHARRVYGGPRDNEFDPPYDPDFDPQYERL